MRFFKRISTTFKTNENTASDKAEDSDERSNQTMVDERERPVTTKQQIATHLSQQDSIEKLNLTEYSFNALTSAGVKTVGELLKLVKSGELRAIHGLRSTSEIEVKLAQWEIVDNSEVDANTDTTLAPDNVFPSREDSIQEPSLIHVPNLPKSTDSRTVGERTQKVESSELQTNSEIETKTNAIPNQNDVSFSRKDPIEKLGLTWARVKPIPTGKLSQEDPIEKLGLTHRSLNVLKHTDIQTVGELLQWVESDRLQIIHRLGPKSISEIKERLAQVKILDGSEGVVNTNATSDRNDAPFSREDSIERLSLTRHTLNLLKHTDIRTVGDLLGWFESGKLQTIPALGRKSILEIEDELVRVNSSDDSGVEANSGTTPDQNDISLSQKDSTEEPSLPQRSPNPHIDTDNQTVGEVAQQVASGESQTISEGTAYTNTILEQNDVYLSRGDAIEKLHLSQRSLKALKRADIRMIGELLPRVEFGKIRVTRGLGQKSIAEIEKKLAQVKVYDNYAHLSREDSIGQLNLRNRSFNAFTRAGIQTIGEVLKLVESGKLQTIPSLGRKSILEVKIKLAQVEILDDSEVEKAAEEQSTISDESQSGNNMGIQPGFQSNSEENSTPPGEGEAAPKLTETKPRSDSQTDAVLQKTWAEIFKITERLAQVKTIQNTLFLREDPIEKMNLSEHSFQTLRGVGIRTVGDVLHLMKSIRLKTIRELGAKCILEIMEIITQGKIFHDSEARWLSSSMWKGLTIKILNDAEVESIIKKGDIPKRVVREQSQLVRKQLSRGLLHEEAIIAEKSIKDWLAGIETTESNRIYEVLATILSASLNICEEIEFFLSQIPGQSRMTVLLSTYGLEPKNLRQTGEELGLSRERVRQIRRELKDKATSISNLKAKPALHRMQSALFIARDLGLDITYEQWAQRIQSSGLVGNWASQEFVGMDAVEAMVAICNLLTDCEIRWLQIPENLQYVIQLATEGKPNVPAKIPQLRDTLPNKVKRLVNRHTKFSGGVNATWLSQEMEMELEEVIDILQGLRYRVLSKGWFVPNPSQVSYNDVFHRCLRKMFQYCERLSIDDICAGIRRGVSRSGFSEPEYLVTKGTVQSRSVFPVPPPDVMADILRVNGYQCEEELYYWDGTYNEKLSKGETVIMNCLKQIGSVLHHSELVLAFIDNQLSLPTLEAVLNYSPLFDRVEHGLYKLRGGVATYHDIERAQAAGEPQSLHPEVRYDTDGNIIVSVTLSTIAVGSGTILCERFPDLSGADWECYVGSERAGELNAVENEFRRLKKPFELLNCQPGDRVKFTFNTWERRVTIEKEGGNAEN